MSIAHMRKRIVVSLVASVAALLFLLALPGKLAIGSAALLPQSATKEVIFGNLATYNHKTGWFSVALPENWTINDKSTPDEAVLLVADPTENGVVVIRAYPSKEISQLELADALQKFMRNHLSNMDGFTMGDTSARKDRTVGIVFHYNQTVEGKSFKMYGEAFIQQRNGFLGIIVFLLPQDQLDSKVKWAYEIIDSFHVTGRTRN